MEKTPKVIGVISGYSGGIVKNTDYKQVSARKTGHVLNNYPEPTGLRYCINSAVLHRIPAAELQNLGYDEFADLFTKTKITIQTLPFTDNRQL